MGPAGEITLQAPQRGVTIDTPLTAVLEWRPAVLGRRHSVIVAADETLKDIIARADDVTGTSLRVALCPEQTYWWQVSSQATTGIGPWSFRTPAPVIRDGAPASQKYVAARPGARFSVPYPPYIMEPMPEDPSIPLSPWFGKKAYDMPPAPSFADVRAHLPAPVLEGAGNRSLLDAYWYAWQLAFDFYLYEPAAKDQAVTYMNAYPYWAGWGSMQYFDTSFIMQYARYAVEPFPYVTVLDNVYCRQHENGFIMKETDNSNHEVWSSDPTLPPLFAWAEWESYLVSGDRERLKQILLPLVKYYEWLQRYQRHDNGHFYTDQGGHGDWGVFMDATIAQMALSISRIAHEVGRPDLSAYFHQESEVIAALIDRDLWDDAHGIYSSRDPQGRLATEPEPGKYHKQIGCAAPLFAGTAPPERAKRVAEHLLNPLEFMGRYGVPNLSFDSSFYVPDWASGYRPVGDQAFRFKETVWPPSVGVAVRALENSGHPDEAASLGERYARALAAVYEKCNDITEHSWVNILELGGNPKFVGWSGYGPIACLIEQVLGFRCDAPSHTLRWRVRRLERHGINRLHVNGVTVSLVCEARASEAEACQISVESDGELHLLIDRGTGTRPYRIRPGRSSLTVAG